jgi:hypothetical protein
VGSTDTASGIQPTSQPLIPPMLEKQQTTQITVIPLISSSLFVPCLQIRMAFHDCGTYSRFLKDVRRSSSVWAAHSQLQHPGSRDPLSRFFPFAIRQLLCHPRQPLTLLDSCSATQCQAASKTLSAPAATAKLLIRARA